MDALQQIRARQRLANDIIADVCDLPEPIEKPKCCGPAPKQNPSGFSVSL